MACQTACAPARTCKRTPTRRGQLPAFAHRSNAAFVQSFDGDLVAFADLSKHLSGNFAIFQNLIRKWKKHGCPLVFFLADGESGEIFLD